MAEPLTCDNCGVEATDLYPCPEGIRCELSICSRCVKRVRENLADRADDTSDIANTADIIRGVLAEVRRLRAAHHHKDPR